MLLDTDVLPAVTKRSPVTMFVAEGDALRQADEDEVLQEAQRIMASRVIGLVPHTKPSSVGQFWIHHFSMLKDRELFAVALLDAQHQIKGVFNVAYGTISEAKVSTREVVKLALREGAAAVVLGHNHPSGYTEPSSADRALTDKIAAALRLVDIYVLDHFVTGGDRYVSFAERGWI